MKTANPVDVARIELLLADLRLPAIKRKRDSEPIDLRASDDCDGVSFCG